MLAAQASLGMNVDSLTKILKMTSPNDSLKIRHQVDSDAARLNKLSATSFKMTFCEFVQVTDHQDQKSTILQKGLRRLAASVSAEGMSL